MVSSLFYSDTPNPSNKKRKADLMSEILHAISTTQVMQRNSCACSSHRQKGSLAPQVITIKKQKVHEKDQEEQSI
jgi:hypothetical protein